EKFPTGAVTGQVEISRRFGLKNPSFAVCRKFYFTRPVGAVKLENDYMVTRTQTYSIRMTAEAPKASAYWSNYAGGGVEPGGVIPVTPGKKYAFRAWVKTDLSAGEGMITLAFFTRNGRWAIVPGHNPSGTESEKVTGKSDWTERNVTLTAPEDANSAVLFFRVKDAVGACWFDDVSFTMTAEEEQKNLAPNPSFENGTPPKVSDWSFWLWAPKDLKPSSACVWDDKVAHSGRRSLKIRGTEPRQVGVWDNDHGGGLIPVVAGKSYCVSVWVRTQMLPQEGLVDRISVGFLDQPGSHLKEGAVTHNPRLTGENDWTRITFTARAPEKAQFARMDLLFSGIGSAWFDDVAFVEIEQKAATEP
ncbi:MAG: hypothetical protein KJ692_07595, partial [Verrucomicrobia bacterium]|nr:hypothetical protein [Verrucomicrobiota bacterium]